MPVAQLVTPTQTLISETFFMWFTSSLSAIDVVSTGQYESRTVELPGASSGQLHKVYTITYRS
jgi:hypothetical protein